MNTPALESLKTNLLSIEEMTALQSLINTLEKSSSKSAIDIYNTAVYQLIRNGGLSEGALTELRTIKKWLDNGAPKYTREYIMAQLGITIPDRAAPVETPVDRFITKRKITQKPKIKVRDILNSDEDSGGWKKVS